MYRVYVVADYACVLVCFQVRNLLKKGLPLEVRPRVWKLFLNSDAPKQHKHFDYQVIICKYAYVCWMCVYIICNENELCYV